MVNSGVYYGLSLNTSNLGGNDYLNFIISGAVEFPALAFATVVLQKIGRRIPLCFLMVVAGTALIVTIFIPKGNHYGYYSYHTTMNKIIMHYFRTFSLVNCFGHVWKNVHHSFVRHHLYVYCGNLSHSRKERSCRNVFYGG